MEKILKTPVSEEEIRSLKTGDVIYVTGRIVTARDDAHKRLCRENEMPKVDLNGGVLYHAGPIVKNLQDGSKTVLSVGPTTSMRMEAYEAEFIEKTGIKVIVGKGGMGEKTAEACKTFGAVHCVFPGGCAVIASEAMKKIQGVEWEDLGMPEALWIIEGEKFGPLIVNIDTHGGNMIEENKRAFLERAEKSFGEIKGKI